LAVAAKNAAQDKSIKRKIIEGPSRQVTKSARRSADLQDTPSRSTALLP
jgi:hypothetical protein